MSATEKKDSLETWRELACEVQTAVMDYWAHENEPKSEMRLLRVVRALDAIRNRKEGGK